MFAAGFRFREPNRESNQPRLNQIRPYADLNTAGAARIFDRAKVDEFYHDLYASHPNSGQDNMSASGYVRADYLDFKFTRLTYDQNERMRATVNFLFEKRLVNIDGPPGDCVFQFMMHVFGPTRQQIRRQHIDAHCVTMCSSTVRSVGCCRGRGNNEKKVDWGREEEA